MKFSTFGPVTMEDNSLNHQNGGQMGPQSASVANNKQNDDNSKSHYSIPGILHFIQHEWARFELERSQWEVDRAELQVSYTFCHYLILKSQMSAVVTLLFKNVEMFSRTNNL